MQSTIMDDSQGTTVGTVDAVNEILSRRIGAQKYRIWFKNSTKLSFADGYLKVGVPNLFIASWIESHFTDEIKAAVREATGEVPRISFNVDPELAGHQRRTQLDSQARFAEKPAVGSTAGKNPNVDQNRKSTPRSLELTLDNFIVGSSNQLAYNAARVVVNDEQSPFNPLFIHGGYGVGKTHLLQGICNAIRLKRPQTKWLYLSAEEFANQFVLALKLRKLEAFRQKMRRTDLLAIDDIHFLASKPSTQEEFLHTFNTISLAGKQVVLASDAHPKMIGQLSEKLVNRFVSGMVVKIDTPDLKTRCEICRQYAEKMMRNSFSRKFGSRGISKTIPDSVIQYICENLRTNVRELEGALLKLLAFASLQNQKISLSMARTVLAEHIARTDPIVHISDIESAVATYFGTTPASIHSSKKDRTVAMARHFSMYLTRKHTNMSSCEIGRFMGNKNHATVLTACKKIDEFVKSNKELNWQGPTGNRVSTARAILTELEAGL